MNDNASIAFDYKTHILIACSSAGNMTVICHWPHVPRQAEVERAMDESKEERAQFLLCTPTAILSGKANGQREQRSPTRRS